MSSRASFFAELRRCNVKLGEPKLAVANLQPIVANDRSGQTEWAIMSVALGPLHCDPEFIELVKIAKTTDPHYARLCGKTL
jgi:hypothetical protein